VYIEFRTGRLERCYLRRREREAAWGRAVARKYIQAVNLLKRVKRVPDLAKFRSFNYHQLKADRKAQHSLDLGDRERLIFTVRKERDSMIAHIEEVSTTHYDH